MFPFLGGSFASFFGGVLVPLFEVWVLPVAFEGAVFLGFSFIFRGEVDVDFFCVFACGVFGFTVGGVDLNESDELDDEWVRSYKAEQIS